MNDGTPAPRPITVDLIGCARCHSDGHDRLTFAPLTYAMPAEDGTEPYTHWAPCPTNGEPILLRNRLKRPGDDTDPPRSGVRCTCSVEHEPNCAASQ